MEHARRSPATLAATAFLLAALGASPAASWATLAWEDTLTGAIVVAADDGSAARATGLGQRPVVSADGRLVAYAAGERGRFADEAWVVPSDGSLPPARVAVGVRPIAFARDGRTVLGVRVSPTTGRDGATVAVEPDLGAVRQLLPRRATLAGFGAGGALLLSEAGAGAGAGAAGRVVEVPLTGGPARTRATLVAGRARRARDGRIAYARSPEGTEIRVAGRERPVGPRCDQDVLRREPVGWTPDGRRLVVADVEAGEDAVTATVISVRTGRRRVLARGLSAVPVLARDGRTLLIERGGDAPRVLAIGFDGGGGRLLARAARSPAWSR